MTPTSPSRGRGGFTLLEVLLSVAILGVLVSITSGLAVQVSAARASLADRSDRVEAARSALWILREELAAQTPGTLRIERRPARPPLVSFAIDAPDPRRVEYWLEGNRLLRRVHARFRSDAPARKHVVTAHVRRFEVTALGDDGWHDSWAATRPPHALTLSFECDGAPPLGLTVVPRAGGTG